MELSTQSLDAVTVITVRGDVDLATAGELEQAIETAGAEGDVILDLRPVGFMDSTGLNGLLTAGRRLEESSRRLALVIERDGTVGRLLDITQLGDVFAWFEDVGDAAAALGGGS